MPTKISAKIYKGNETWVVDGVGKKLINCGDVKSRVVTIGYCLENPSEIFKGLFQSYRIQAYGNVKSDGEWDILSVPGEKTPEHADAGRPSDEWYLRIQYSLPPPGCEIVAKLDSVNLKRAYAALPAHRDIKEMKEAFANLVWHSMQFSDGFSMLNYLDARDISIEIKRDWAESNLEKKMVEKGVSALLEGGQDVEAKIDNVYS